jgi:aldose 1-epimerase
MASTSLTLTAASLVLELSPARGGAIANFHHHGEQGRTPIMRESRASLANVLEAASFPLVPFVNRVRGGAFAFRGRTIRMAPNMADDPSPLHGQGWLGAWQVERADQAHAHLSFRHSPGEWPWEYEARQEFALDAGGLAVALTCRNLDTRPMPCGLGQHPYFPCGPGTVIDTRVGHVWTIDEQVLPVEKVPASGRFDLRERAICGQELDHGFGGWGGTTRISDPAWPFEILLSSPNAGFFQVYSPQGGGFFVAEPVSHANAALNEPEHEWAELGLKVLEAGEEMRLDMRVEVSPARHFG